MNRIWLFALCSVTEECQIRSYLFNNHDDITTSKIVKRYTSALPHHVNLIAGTQQSDLRVQLEIITKGTDSKQNLFRLIPYRLFHGELVIQDKAQHSSVDFNLLN